MRTISRIRLRKVSDKDDDTNEEEEGEMKEGDRNNTFHVGDLPCI